MKNLLIFILTGITMNIVTNISLIHILINTEYIFSYSNIRLYFHQFFLYVGVYEMWSLIIINLTKLYE